MSSTGRVPLLDENDRFPDRFAPPSVAADAAAAEAARAGSAAAASDATAAKTGAETARDEADAAAVRAEAVPAQVDTAMAEQVGTGGEFDTKLNATIVDVVDATIPDGMTTSQSITEFVTVAEPPAPDPGNAGKFYFVYQPEAAYFTDFSEGLTSSDEPWVTGGWTADAGMVNKTGGSSLARRGRRLLTPQQAVNQEVVARVRVHGSVSALACPLIVRGGGDSGAEEGIQAGFITAGTRKFRIERFNTGARVTLADMDLEYAIDGTTFMWIRLRAEGETVSAKAWQDGTSEPAEWTLTAATTYTDPGWAGFGGYGAALQQFDSLGYVNGGRTAPVVAP